VTVVIGSKSLRTRTCQKSKLRRPATGAGAGGGVGARAVSTGGVYVCSMMQIWQLVDFTSIRSSLLSSLLLLVLVPLVSLESVAQY
jgi:hypothetical protein